EYARELEQIGVRCEASPTPLFGAGAFAVKDPDGRRIVFGLPEETCGENGLPARLQHFVCATSRLPEMVKFYGDLGMIESDRVLENDSLAACFLRSDPEHHSFAAFRAPESRPDHHCYETNGGLGLDALLMRSSACFRRARCVPKFSRTKRGSPNCVPGESATPCARKCA